MCVVCDVWDVCHVCDVCDVCHVSLERRLSDSLRQRVEVVVTAGNTNNTRSNVKHNAAFGRLRVSERVYVCARVCVVGVCVLCVLCVLCCVALGGVG